MKFGFFSPGAHCAAGVGNPPGELYETLGAMKNFFIKILTADVSATCTSRLYPSGSE